MSTLCSENYRHFYNALQAETVSSDDILNLVPGALEYVVDELHIGKFEIQIELAASSSEAAAYNKSKVMYVSPDGFDYMAHARVIKTLDKGRVSFAVFPQKGYEWNDEEKGALDHLIKNLFIIMAKARLTELVKKRQLTDHLTMLPNTTSFSMFARDLGLKGILGQYTVIFSNLKNFSYINQTLGSRAGDIVLKEYANKLKDMFSTGEIIARFGGDNFVALLKDENVDKYLKNISRINIPVALGNQTRTFTITARSGIYSIPETMSNPGEAVTRANISLEHARHSGDSDRIYFTEQILAQANREREIISEFKKALSRKEFIVYYQPKVNLTTGAISGCEALVRWNKNGQIIPPVQFIPVLETQGMICELDFYVLDRVCADIVSWIRDGITPARVSVNFSKHHLRNPNLVDDIMAVITSHGISPTLIEIELTESASGEDYVMLGQFIDELKTHGIFTSIDDFGTGYSSLSLLKDLHVNVIKIDKSFVDNIAGKDKRDRIILGSILTMVTGLGMEVIAEGCEDEEQARILKEMDCTTIQGYLFDKPMACEEFTKKLADKFIYDVSC
ncbi:MAG: EAL domain-containing protein [Lachnospiraceae bacterium]|nr:EAL domain-containing protein [Lachnospiraceae bacterium]